MTPTVIRRRTALALFVLLLAAAPCVGLLVKQIGTRDINDWIYAFCLTQTVLLAACAVYGPGRLIARMPLVIAWGLAVGFALALLNLITSQTRASLAAGAILVGTGTLSSLIIFATHRWRTRVFVAFGDKSSGRTIGRSAHQLSLQMLLILTAAFAVAGVAARVAITAPPDAFGTDGDILILHGWLGFFPCLGAAPALLVVFRPSWRIVLACAFFVLVTLADPLLLTLAAPTIFGNNNFFGITTWEFFSEVVSESILHAQAAVAVLIYAILARAAGFRMLVPGQSNDKKPNPSAQPATEAGCVQD